jgi:hypothetical protein
MFFCERCKTSYNATVAAASGECPRCKAKEGITAPLRFRLLEPSALKVAALKPAYEETPPAQSRMAKQ